MRRADAPPRLVMIFGSAAVGKMTVGQQLCAFTGFKLLYNHRVVDLATDLFEFGTPAFHRIARGFTLELLDTAAEQGLGLVLTHGLIFSSPSARTIIDDFSRSYVSRGHDVAYVELCAPLATRLERNETENRRAHKKVDWSTAERLTEMESWGAWHSDGDFPYSDRHLALHTADLTAAAAARAIASRFNLPLDAQAHPD